jgi:hypothetical protein
VCRDFFLLREATDRQAMVEQKKNHLANRPQKKKAFWENPELKLRISNSINHRLRSKTFGEEKVFCFSEKMMNR